MRIVGWGVCLSLIDACEGTCRSHGNRGIRANHVCALSRKRAETGGLLTVTRFVKLLAVVRIAAFSCAVRDYLLAVIMNSCSRNFSVRTHNPDFMHCI